MDIPPITETEFQNQVIEYAQMFGWRVAHFRPARTNKGWRTPIQGDPGFPDLVLARDGHIILWELKSEKGKLTDDQRAWLGALGGTCDRVHVGTRRPSEWDAIEYQLRFF